LQQSRAELVSQVFIGYWFQAIFTSILNLLALIKICTYRPPQKSRAARSQSAYGILVGRQLKEAASALSTYSATLSFTFIWALRCGADVPAEIFLPLLLGGNLSIFSTFSLYFWRFLDSQCFMLWDVFMLVILQICELYLNVWVLGKGDSFQYQNQPAIACVYHPRSTEMAFATAWVGFAVFGLGIALVTPFCSIILLRKNRSSPFSSQLWAKFRSHRMISKLILAVLPLAALAVMWMALGTLSFLRLETLLMRPDDEGNAWSLGQQLAVAAMVLIGLRAVYILIEQRFKISCTTCLVAHFKR